MGIARVHLTDASRAAVARGGPLMCGVVIVGAILFSKNGMTAADAVAAMAASPPLAAGIFVAWVLASAPAVRPLFGTPSTLYLRSLAPPARFLPPVALAVAFVETPWVVLYTRGAGVLAGLAALLCAAGAHALLASGRLGVVAATGIAAAVALAPTLALVGAGALACVVGVPAAFHAAAVAPTTARSAVAGPPVVALALAAIASSWRGARAAWTRALIVIAASGALCALLAKNLDLDGWARIRLALGVGGPAIVLAAGGILQALFTADDAGTWLLDATGVPVATRRLARALALASVGALIGVVHGIVSAGPVGGAAALIWGAGITLVLGPVVKRVRHRQDASFLLAAAVGGVFAVAAGVMP